MRAAILAVVVGAGLARAQSASTESPEPSPPPLVETAPDAVEPDLAVVAPARRPLPSGRPQPIIVEAPAPVTEQRAASAPEVESTVEPSESAPGRAERWGVIAVGGPEAIISDAGGVGVRIGIGARFALVERDGSDVQAVPTVGLVMGYDYSRGHRAFGEVRVELLAARPGGLCQPGFTLYALSGVDVGVGVEGYVGAGIGWNWVPKSGGGLGGLAGLAGLGGVGGLAGVAIAIVALPVIAVLVLAGRVEVRYFPALARHGAPSAVAFTLGVGF